MTLFLILFAQASFAQANSITSPNVSANALFLYQHSNLNDKDLSTTRNGVDLREAEIAFYADVDPYTQLKMILALRPQYEVSGGSVEQSFILEPEELYADTRQIPGLTLKLGKFLAAFGKHNELHTHAFPFIDAPLANTYLLGDEGLNDVGFSAAYLIPTNWYNEITLQFLRGEGENTQFNSAKPGDGVGLVHWKNLVDLSDSLTAELGGSYAEGQNSLKGKTTLTGADLTFKYRPVVGGKYHSAIFAGEYLHRQLEQPGHEDEIGYGWNVWGQYQFAERWAAKSRYDHFSASGGHSTNSSALTTGKTNKYAASIVFNATEFSSYQVEYSYSHFPKNSFDESEDKKIYFQANFTIGAHPTHRY